MKEITKDLFCLCISTFGVTFGHIWPVIFTYYTSYCYYQNRNTKVNDIYASFFAFLIGQLLSSAFFPYLFYILGTSYTYLLFAVLETITCVYSIYHINFGQVCIVLFVKGILFQGIPTASNIILSEKYQDGILKSKYVNSARVCLSLFVVFICQVIVNPQNEPQNQTSKNGDYFFQDKISKNFSNFLIIYSIITVISVLAPCFFIKPPKNYKSKILQFTKSIIQKKEFEFNIANKLNTTSDKNLLKKFNTNNKDEDQNSEKYSIMINGEEINTQKNINISQKFVHFLGIVIALNFAITYYIYDIYKYLALIIGFSDFTISSVFASGIIFYISGNFICTYLWEKNGFDQTIFFIIVVNFLNLICILLSKQYFILEILFARMFFGYILQFQDLFCYNLFDSFEAMKQMKYLIMYNAIGELIQIILNYLLFNNEEYELIIIVLTILSIFSIFVYYSFIKGNIKNNQFFFIIDFNVIQSIIYWVSCLLIQNKVLKKLIFLKKAKSILSSQIQKYHIFINQIFIQKTRQFSFIVV